MHNSSFLYVRSVSQDASPPPEIGIAFTSRSNSPLNFNTDKLIAGCSISFFSENSGIYSSQLENFLSSSSTSSNLHSIT
ncbi:hypothetical protein M5689_017025 [Euphorbia peplus]|nr:hypothetical protein M5689_017025 [Euphorbia peplus]